jgi:glutathione S-transferase
VLDDGTSLYDSVVICEYLDTLHDGPKLFPTAAAPKWTALRRHALGNGLLELLILWRNERERDHPEPALLTAFREKYHASLDTLERDAGDLAATPVGIGHIAIGCALSYVDFRFPDLDWRADHPCLAAWHHAFAARPSMRMTEAREG